MKKKITKKLKRRKQRIQYRLRDINWKEQNKPMFSASNIHYDIADRTRGLAYGGIGGIQLLANVWNSSVVPSGDQRGLPGLMPVLNALYLPSDTRPIRISPWDPHAILLPSGDQLNTENESFGVLPRKTSLVVPSSMEMILSVFMPSEGPDSNAIFVPSGDQQCPKNLLPRTTSLVVPSSRNMGGVRGFACSLMAPRSLVRIHSNALQARCRLRRREPQRAGPSTKAVPFLVASSGHAST